CSLRGAPGLVHQGSLDPRPVLRQASIYQRSGVQHESRRPGWTHDGPRDADAALRHTQGMTLAEFPDDWQTALCVAAHPDDLEYGTAAAVAGWTASGKSVSYLLATRGEAGIDSMPPEEAAPARAQEERDGAAEVGVDRVDFLDFTDGAVEFGLPLRKAIAAHIRRVRPDLVVSMTSEEFFPGGFLNQADHRAVGLATLDACADAGNQIGRASCRER